MTWRVCLVVAALTLLTGCAGGTQQELAKCQALPGAQFETISPAQEPLERNKDDWNDSFILDCMQKKGYVMDSRLPAHPGVTCGERDDPDIYAVCYRRDNMVAAWYVGLTN